MKRFLAILALVFVSFAVYAQSENSIIIDQKSFRPVQTDDLIRMNIDPIGMDSSRRSCARIKMKINRMSREDIDKLDVKIVTNNQLTKCKTADYENGLILEMTAKPATRFYLNHPRYGESNEVNLNLEPNKEYRIDVYLNQQLSITIISDVVGADVYIDDIFVGQTNANKMLAVHNVTPEKHALRVEYSGRRAVKDISVSSDNLAFLQDVLFVEQNRKQGSMIVTNPDATADKKYKIGDIVIVNGVKGVVFQTYPQVKIVSVVTTSAKWGKYGVTTGATDSDNGAKNMATIKAISGWYSKYPAFKWCADLGNGWYLPAKNELKVLYDQKAAINKILSTNDFDKLGSKNSWVWSSTEDSSGNAYGVYFSNGYVYDDNKDSADAVRAVATLGENDSHEKNVDIWSESNKARIDAGQKEFWDGSKSYKQTMIEIEKEQKDERLKRIEKELGSYKELLSKEAENVASTFGLR